MWFLGLCRKLFLSFCVLVRKGVEGFLKIWKHTTHKSNTKQAGFCITLVPDKWLL